MLRAWVYKRCYVLLFHFVSVYLTSPQISSVSNDAENAASEKFLRYRSRDLIPGHCRPTARAIGSVFVPRNVRSISSRLSKIRISLSLSLAAILDLRAYRKFEFGAGCVSHVGQLSRPPRRSRRIGGRAVGGSTRAQSDVTLFKRRAAWDTRISRTTHAAPCASPERPQREIPIGRRERERERERERLSALSAYSLPSLPLSLFFVLSLCLVSPASRFLFHPIRLPEVSPSSSIGGAAIRPGTRDPAAWSRYALEG